MARIVYATKKFAPATLEIIEQANQICDGYAADGLVLTLRQLYYQFVARDLLRNSQSEYKRLGDILRDARMAGLMDWDHLIDRTRNVMAVPQQKDPADMVRRASKNFHIDLWKGQFRRVLVFIEKDAAIGVIEGVCQQNDVPYFSTRGYPSISELHSMASRIQWYLEQGEQVIILHIGDHDPSGLDMTRDIRDRLDTFVLKNWLDTWGAGWKRPVTRGAIRQGIRDHLISKGSTVITDRSDPWTLRRIALNINQIQRYAPPPNPAKSTDARFAAYVELTGLDDSWELDALEPRVLQDLIQSEIDSLRDEDVWADRVREQEIGRQQLIALSANWEHIAPSLSTEGFTS